MPQIVCTGRNKTATTSIFTALEMLGYRATKRPWNGAGQDWPPLHAGVIRERCAPIWDAHDAFTDYPPAYLVPLIDQRYPGSKFIHTYRSEGAWLRSSMAYYQQPNPTHEMLYNGHGKCDTPEARAVWVARYQMHNDFVRTYFERRPGDLLSINIDEPGALSWDPICAFLGKPRPKNKAGHVMDFPHANKSRRAA
jgi:hypothetical protein